MREIGAYLDRVPEAVYYHVHALRRAGLIKRAGERIVGGRKEAIYESVADGFRLEPGRASSSFRESMADTCDAMLRFAGRNYRRGVTSKKAVFEGDARNVLTRCATVRLSPRQLARVNRKLDELVRLLLECDAVGDGGAVTFAAVLSPASPRQ